MIATLDIALLMFSFLELVCVLLSRSWSLGVLFFPCIAGLEGVLSLEDQETLRSSELSADVTSRLRPTFETLEASLTEGR